MREHGTHACYVWGPEPGAGDGCRCDDCRVARAAYERRRTTRTAPPYVGADRARRHVTWLATQGVGMKQVAKTSGVSHGALWKLMYGNDGKTSKRIRQETEEKILTVTPADAADGARVDAAPTWEHVTELLARGWTKAAISKAIGQNGRALQLGDREVTAGNARAIAGLLDQPVPPRHTRWGEVEIEEPDTEPEPPRWLPGETDPVVAVAELLEERNDQQWRAYAACRLPDVPTWLFFPTRGDTATTEAAKKVCRTCPVSGECLAAHLGEKVGIYGGLSARERRRMREAVAA